MQNYVYIIFSSTPTKMGKLIRSFTQNQCNHVSITMDPNLSHCYSFARRYHRTPLYGGFVTESNARYHRQGEHAQIHVCKIPVTAQQAQLLADKFSQMERSCDHYLYNHLSALGALLRKPIQAKDAYTCVEFCVHILWQLDYPVTPGQFYSVDELDELLREYRIYEGPMPVVDISADEYFATRHGIAPIIHTIRDFFRLIPRVGKQ